MNKIFKVIFNRTTQKMEVVSELARSQGKAASSTDERDTIKLAAAGILGEQPFLSVEWQPLCFLLHRQKRRWLLIK
ncbi:Uncharacterised protein [Mannheimia haemolytica]|uniref:ESPR domain-containing protein n=1 Tax=Mannheimia haemolytica TaxID=75985 RepID=A0A378MU13_MANHA|nr:Uncharacterised protein [Mannheimia haemolytica]